MPGNLLVLENLRRGLALGALAATAAAFARSGASRAVGVGGAGALWFLIRPGFLRTGL